MAAKTNILVITDWYPPAYKAGGPVQSIYRIAQLLKEDFEVFVLTTNRDLGNEQVAEESSSNKWIDQVGVKVYYSSISATSTLRVKSLIDDVLPQTIYINGLFSRYFTIPFLQLLLKKKAPKIVVGVRGMLKPSALNTHSLKKKAFLWLIKSLSIGSKITFHTTDDEETRFTKTTFGGIVEVIEIPNIPYISLETKNYTKEETLKIIYAARLHPIKNLKLVLDELKKVSINIHLTIIGVVDDQKYWAECNEVIKSLPSNIQVNYKGSLPHTQLMEEWPKNDVYILPTLGENFGHSIFEAMSAGLPVIISDQTPWRDLVEQKVGYDLPLDKPQGFIKALEHFASMDQGEYDSWSNNASGYANEFFNRQDYLKEYTDLFTKKTTVGFIGPMPLSRYKGGISVFTKNVLDKKDAFLKEDIDLKFINTCVVPRSNESTGKINWVNMSNYFSFLKMSFKEVKASRIDILHFNSSIGFSLIKDTFTALILKFFCRTKNILQIHYADEDQLYRNNIYRKLVHFFIHLGTDQIIVLSDKMNLSFKNRNIVSDVKTILHFQKLVIEKSEDKEANRVRQFLFLGSLDQRKGIKDLILALQAIAHLDWQLKVGGEFTDEVFKRELLQLIEKFNLGEKVLFHGYVSGEEKAKLLSQSEVFILPSYGEGFPLAIVEAMNYGNAIVSTDVGANGEQLGAVSNLTQPGDIQGLALELKKMIEDSAYMRERQNQAFMGSKSFSFDKFRNKLTQVYNSLS